MINPCNLKNEYIQYNPKYNLPTHINNRYSLDYVEPTPAMFKKHKFLLLQHTRITNGPGMLRPPRNFNNISYKLNVDSIVYKNTIFKLPCKLQPYIKLIQSLIDKGFNIQQIIQYAIDTYNIPDVIFNSTIYQNKRLYTYPHADISVPATTTNTINTSAPYKIGEFIDNIVSLQPIIDDLILDNPYVVTPQYTSTIFVSNNDNKTFTNNFNDLLPNGSASFFGSYLLNTTYTDTTVKWKILIFIDPHEPPYLPGYGYLIDSSKYSLNKGLIFIPIHTFESLLVYKKYKSNMPFTIRNQRQSFSKLILTTPCKYQNTVNLLTSVGLE
jgi:hypothetical protein